MARGLRREIVGSGEFVYERVDGWPQLPPDWTLGQVGIAAGSDGLVYLFNRSEHPLVVVTREGEYVASWGEGVLTSAHGIFVDKHDRLYLPVTGSHVVAIYSRDGAELASLGTAGAASNPECTGQMRQYFGGPPPSAFGPFSLPTDVAVSENGSIYVTDGYANARVHRFSASGELLQSWGTPGHRPGQFWTPHGVWVYDDHVFVADRENHRLQIFDEDGRFVEEWVDFKSPCDVVVRDDIVFVTEGIGARPRHPLGSVSIRTLTGETVAEWSHSPARPGHSLWVDDEDSIYLGQTVEGDRIVKYRRI